MNPRSFLWPVACLAIALTCQTALADRLVRKKIGPRIYQSYRVDDPEPMPTVKWRERTTRNASATRREIRHETVCADYEPGSIVYRHCRQAAKELFEEKCATLDDKYRSAGKSTAKRRQVERDMFCRAASGFCP